MEQARQKYQIEALKAQAQLEDRREERSHQAQMLNAELATRMTTEKRPSVARATPPTVPAT